MMELMITFVYSYNFNVKISPMSALKHTHILPSVTYIFNSISTQIMAFAMSESDIFLIFLIYLENFSYSAYSLEKYIVL